MHRIFVNPREIKDSFAKINSFEANHIKNVLRLKIGDEIFLFDGEGKEYRGKIVSTKPKEVIVKIEAEIEGKNRESPFKITLFQSLLKKDKFEWIIEKVTELGIEKIYPIISSRTIPQKIDFKNKMLRWERILKASSSQCGRNKIPRIGELRTFSDSLKNLADFDLALILWERAEGVSPLIFERRGINSCAFFVGPEGGFTEKEIEEGKRAGAKIVSLGSRILKSETAAITFCAILQYVFGDLRAKR